MCSLDENHLKNERTSQSAQAPVVTVQQQFPCRDRRGYLKKLLFGFSCSQVETQPSVNAQPLQRAARWKVIVLPHPTTLLKFLKVQHTHTPPADHLQPATLGGFRESRQMSGSGNRARKASSRQQIQLITSNTHHLEPLQAETFLLHTQAATLVSDSQQVSVSEVARAAELITIIGKKSTGREEERKTADVMKKWARDELLGCFYI